MVVSQGTPGVIMRLRLLQEVLQTTEKEGPVGPMQGRRNGCYHMMAAADTEL